MDTIDIGQSESAPRFIDAHTHTYLRGMEDLLAMKQAGITHAVVCAYLPTQPSSADTLIDLFHWLDREERERLAKAGIREILALGIHPRSLPPLREMHRVFQEIRTLAADGRIQAIGEVGLETGSSEERTAFREQLSLSLELDLPLIMHTPRTQKFRMTLDALFTTTQCGVPQRNVIADHLTPDLVGEVRRSGGSFRMGVTVQPGKAANEDVLAIVREYGTENIHLDSDMSQAASTPCSVAQCAAFLLENGVSAQDVRALTFDNAARIFGVSESL